MWRRGTGSNTKSAGLAVAVVGGGGSTSYNVISHLERGWHLPTPQLSPCITPVSS